jgi:DNA-binding winged helix-turn-helix (wHTH) protein
MSTSAASASQPDVADRVWTSHACEETHRSFAFGPFILKPGRQLLLKDDIPMRIGGRALDILTALIERPGELVSKRELLSRVWPDTFVEEANLKTNILSLRRILGDRPDAPQYIATVVGRGYRFVADVRLSTTSRQQGVRPRLILETDRPGAGPVPSDR